MTTLIKINKMTLFGGKKVKLYSTWQGRKLWDRVLHFQGWRGLVPRQPGASTNGEE
jgi:hypothetical protein